MCQFFSAAPPPPRRNSAKWVRRDRDKLTRCDYFASVSNVKINIYDLATRAKRSSSVRTSTNAFCIHTRFFLFFFVTLIIYRRDCCIIDFARTYPGYRAKKSIRTMRIFFFFRLVFEYFPREETLIYSVAKNILTDEKGNWHKFRFLLVADDRRLNSYIIVWVTGIQ